jgi:hypothetical protein
MSGALVPVAAPSAPAPTPTERFVARVQASNPAYQLGDARREAGGQVVPVTTAADPRGNIAAFNAEQVKAGRQLTGEAATRNQAAVNKFSDQMAFATALKKHINKEGMVKSDTLNRCAPLLEGYRLPDGITVHAATTCEMLMIARKAGFQQSNLDAYFRAAADLGLTS